MPLASTITRQADTARSSARPDSSRKVRLMVRSCSAACTAASVPIRFRPVRQPLRTPHRQETGKNKASSRMPASISRRMASTVPQTSSAVSVRSGL